MSIQRLWGFTTAVLAAAASVASPRSPLPAGLVLYRARAHREERRIDCGRAPRPRHNPAPSGAEPEEDRCSALTSGSHGGCPATLVQRDCTGYGLWSK